MIFSKILLFFILINGFGKSLVKGLSLKPFPPHKINTVNFFKVRYIHKFYITLIKVFLNF